MKAIDANALLREIHLISFLRFEDKKFLCDLIRGQHVMDVVPREQYDKLRSNFGDFVGTAKLSPCPCCGGEAEHVNKVENNPVNRGVSISCFVRCKSCGLTTKPYIATDSSFDYKDEATEAWNRRTL